jgi:hypothetical protein
VGGVTLDFLEAAARLFEPAPESPYLHDPQAWASDKLGAFLWSKQRDIFASVVANRRTAVRSCHGAGKSWSAGALAAWWIDTHPPGEAIVVSTAPTYKQVHAVLWEEIRKQHRTGGLPGTVLGSDEWKINDILVGMGRKPADHDEHGFQGIHRRYVLAILDEACGIPAALWNAVEAITTNDDCRILAIGNPDDPNTEFGNVCQPGSGWNILQISSFDTPNLSGEDVPDFMRTLLPSAGWVEDARKRWGEDSPVYLSKVLGEFPKTSANTLIPAPWIRAAQERDLPFGYPATLGVDVARFGTDRTVIYRRSGGKVRLHSDRNGDATTATTGLVVTALRDTGSLAAHVDGVGVGGGVVDMLREQGHPVEDMQAGGGAIDPTRFVNARAEWYWDLRKMFEDGEIDLDPTDDELAAQLGSIRFEYDSRGRIKIESKDDMRKRGMPSPDHADAVMLAVAHPHQNPKATYGIATLH